MLKKLRNSLIKLSMIFVTLLIVISFFTVYFITNFYINKQNEDKIINLYPTQISKLSESGDIAVIEVQYSISFTVFLNEYDQIIDIKSFFDINESDYNAITETALSKNKENGIFEYFGKRFMFKKFVTTEAFVVDSNANTNSFNVPKSTQITFLDVTESYNVLNKILIIFCIIGPLIVLGTFFISLLFANRAILPIENSMTKQKRFISDASHELKTPIAIISANAEVALANKDNPDELPKWIANITEQSDRLNRLVSNFLTLAKSEELMNKVDILPICLSDLIEQAITNVEAFIFDKNIQLTTSIKKDLWICANGGMLNQIVLILLDNAMKYTNENGTINITLTSDKNNLFVCFENTTLEQLSENNIEQLFDRFYRADDSRINNGSFGLGLAIAKEFVDKCYGNITVTIPEKHKIMFLIMFKKYKK